MNLIHQYIYREVLLLAGAITSVLTFLMLSATIFREFAMMMYLPMDLALRLMFLGVPLILTITIPAGLLAAVMIVFGRMSSDRELVALKAAGIGLAPIVAPVIILAMALSGLDYLLIAYTVPQCQKQVNSMKHEVVTSNPMALLTPEEVCDKIPNCKILFDTKQGSELNDVLIWNFDEGGHLTSQLRANHATVSLDLDHQQLVITMLDGREEDFPGNGDVTKVHAGVHGEQMVRAFSLSSFYDKVQRKLAWMTLPDIWDIIYSMQSSPSTEQASPYLTELQARVSFSITTFTFVVVGLPLAIQTQRRETSFGVIATGVIFLLYYVLGQVGHALKAHAGLYPELIIWAPNFLFQAVGFYLFYKANRK